MHTYLPRCYEVAKLLNVISENNRDIEQRTKKKKWRENLGIVCGNDKWKLTYIALIAMELQCCFFLFCFHNTNDFTVYVQNGTMKLCLKLLAKSKQSNEYIGDYFWLN